MILRHIDFFWIKLRLQSVPYSADNTVFVFLFCRCTYKLQESNFCRCSNTWKIKLILIHTDPFGSCLIHISLFPSARLSSRCERSPELWWREPNPRLLSNVITTFLFCFIFPLLHSLSTQTKSSELPQSENRLTRGLSQTWSLWDPLVRGAPKTPAHLLALDSAGLSL